MKKALSVFLMLALVGSVFAAEPVADSICSRTCSRRKRCRIQR